MKELKINYHYLGACDMSCKHCFRPLNKTKINHEEIINTFENLCKVTTTINLVGGEVFLDIPLLKKLVAIGLQKRVAITVVSNGNRLLEQLNHQDVEYILRHIKLLGISIDSFSLNTNKKIGRVVEGKSLEILDLLKLRKKLKQSHTKFKVNTVISKHNMEEDMLTMMTSLNVDVWKVIQVESNDANIQITSEEFDLFTERHLAVKNLMVERNEILKTAYVMFNAKGDLYYDHKYLDFNINTFNEEQSSIHMFYEKLDELGLNKEDYFARYKNHENTIYFNKKQYINTLGKYIEKGNTLFLDVESISPRYSDSKEYIKYTKTQLHVLYCAVAINPAYEIIGEFSDSINPVDNLAKIYDKSNMNIDKYHQFYKDFLCYLKKYKIRRIVVSCLETETRFLQDAIYYMKNLSRKDYEYLQSLMNQMLDIQLIKNKEIIKVETKSSASRNILESLRKQRKDLFIYTRAEEKSHDSSREVCLTLAEIYFRDTVDYDEKKIITKIKEYCKDDVMDDFELLYSYEMLNRSSVLKVDKNKEGK